MAHFSVSFNWFAISCLQATNSGLNFILHTVLVALQEDVVGKIAVFLGSLIVMLVTAALIVAATFNVNKYRVP
jgi:hypothetical protein